MSVLENSRSTTGTNTRYKDVSPTSGMCPICEKDCPILCEIGKSSFRGREVLYPKEESFGKSTAGANKDYGLTFGDLQIMVALQGAEGIEADSDKAIFPNADITSNAGGVPIKVPVIIAGLGSTAVAHSNWDGLAIGAAISGTIMTVGENVCGMDPKSRYENGLVKYSEDLKYRVETYRKFWDGTHGDIAVQTNVEDQRGGVDLYAIQELGVNIIERKWGQGAKAIGGEVRIFDLDKALLLKSRGYVVLPDPEDPAVQAAFKARMFESFERHSRVGMPEEIPFIEDVKWLRAQGAKRVFLKTGAYNPAAVAFTLRVASEAKVDFLTFDGAGGGTGMSPVPMMHECSTPTLYLAAQVLKGAQILKSKGKYVPGMAIAGGIIDETQIFKAIAMSNFGDGPFFKAVAMARSPITAVMKADYFARLAEADDLPHKFADLYGKKPEQFFVSYYELKEKYGDAVGKEIPWSAVGLYTYFINRIGTGLKQLMAGNRKFKLDLLSRSDLASLTERCERVTGIPTIDKKDEELFEAILDYESDAVVV